ncbi:nuclear transport factor 2 family protein [Reyranella sp.]|uniref:nuclear transport factor 2 family protein n=1 Tax=Reyranella sp. TaxID=1929291 RepID=UPI0025D61FE4|nr:nuclear transport factor 2 family protein [Reyranella sp.]
MPADAIRQVLAAKADAMVRRSAETLTALLHDDFIYVNAGGTRFDKLGYIETYCTSGKVVFHEQEIDDLLVGEFPGFAVATLTVRDRFNAGGREVLATYRSLCVFTDANGKWLWAAGQTMPTS